MATSAASERVFNMAGHVVNCRKANFKEFSGERRTLYEQCCEKEALKVD